MNLTIDEVHAKLNAAYDLVQAMTDQAACDNQTVADAKRELQEARDSVLRHYFGKEKDLGSNEAARSASIAALCEEQQKELTKAERAQVLRLMQLDVARLEVERWKSNLRLLELSCGDCQE